MRPDEQSSLSEIERNKRADQKIKGGLKTAASIGLTAAGAGIAAKVSPFLSDYITTDLAIKGISKVSPKIGEFLKNGMKQGLDAKSGLDFLKKSLGMGTENQEAEQPQAQQQAAPPEQKNIIQQYSPELYEFLKGNIDSGRSVLEAGALAQIDNKYKSVIQKIEKDHKAPWSGILSSIFGQSEQPKPQQQAQQPQGQDMNQRVQAPQQSEKPQQSNNGDAALIAALEKILKM